MAYTHQHTLQGLLSTHTHTRASMAIIQYQTQTSLPSTTVLIKLYSNTDFIPMATGCRVNCICNYCFSLSRVIFFPPLGHALIVQTSLYFGGKKKRNLFS
ncbi:hypothetical protein KOW79_006565 [Hemibagrus wyckioides]|uniref:Uncharacterized protein n=1 Tax=Hemibagrus wyckioides TaxID=337641 RepID=A0A9D3NZX1_9TELE|nr:hypothetical protein KOW79_006565 [Hemibagrus wyckioides]